MEQFDPFEEFEKGVLKGAWPEGRRLEARFDELDETYAKTCSDRELARHYAKAALAESRRQTMRIVEQYHRFATLGEIPF